MKRKLLSLTVLLLVLINLFVFSLPALAQDLSTPTSNPVTCNDAEVYLKQNRIDLAEKAFTVVLTENPQEQCALEGLADAAQAKCTVAATLAPTNPSGANMIYVGILTSYPQLECAYVGLAAVVTPTPSVTLTPSLTLTQSPTPTPNPYDVVEGLISVGDYPAAQTKMVDAISTSPSTTQIARFNNKPLLYYQNLRSNLIPLFLTLFLVVLVVWWIVRLQKLRLDVEDFDISTVKIAGASTDGPDFKKILTLHFEHALNNLCHAVPLTKPDLITTPLAIPELPSITSIPQEARDIWTFLTKAIPANLMKFTGNLEFDPVRGAGLTMRLVHARSNSIRGTYTVWKEDIDSSYQVVGQSPTLEDYMDLVEPAAIWAYWHAYRRWPFPTRKFQRSFGTSVLESYTAVKLANKINDRYKRLQDDEQQKTKLNSMRSMLGRAITYDNQNSIAHLNLGVILYFASQKGDHGKNPPQGGSEKYFLLEMARMHLERSRMLSENAGNMPDATYINACYTLALIEIDAFLDELDLDQETKPNNKENLLGKAEELLNAAFFQAQAAVRKNKMLFTEDYSTMIQIPLMDVRWWMEKTNDGEAKVSDPLEKEIANKVFAAPRIHYNLACHYTLAVKIMGADSKNLDTALGFLEYVFGASPVYASKAKDDKTLEYLQQNRKTEFEKLVKKYSPSKPAKSTNSGETQKTPIAQWVGEENAAALQKKNIETVPELLRRTMKRDDRQKLAQECNLDEDDLLKWAYAAELIRVSGMEAGHVALLYKANFRTLDALARSNKHELFDTVKEYKEKLKLDIKLPDKETLAWWIQQAKLTRSTIR